MSTKSQPNGARPHAAPTFRAPICDVRPRRSRRSTLRQAMWSVMTVAALSSVMTIATDAHATGDTAVVEVPGTEPTGDTGATSTAGLTAGDLAGEEGGNPCDDGCSTGSAKTGLWAMALVGLIRRRTFSSFRTS